MWKKKKNEARTQASERFFNLDNHTDVYE